MKSLLGAAWKESVKEDPKRHYFRAVLDLGILGALACRIVANVRKAKETSPDWLVFHTSAVGGEDVRVGALWNYRHPETAAEYAIGRIRASAFGLVELRGGAKVDLRLSGDEMSVRLSEVSERRGEDGPTHQLWRMAPHSRGKGATGAAKESPTDPIIESAEEAEEEVLQEGTEG